MKYKLLKDLPNCKIGTIAEVNEYNVAHFDAFNFYISDLKKHTDWFEPVIERWRARNGENYYFVSQRSIVDSLEETFHPIDEKHFDFGNYFETRKQAEEASKRIKKVLMDYHKELGE